jgi:negative regulator of flagellin synthesis FlgM
MTQSIGGIDLQSPTTGSAAPAPAPSVGSDAADGQPTSTGGGDVQITRAASQLAQLEQSLQAQPAVDTARVATARQALASGSYQVDPERIAAGLLQTEQALGS